MRPKASQCVLRVMTPDKTRRSSATEGSQMKVLLVEDDLDQLDITAYMLRRERFTVIEASDAAQALRRFKVERPGLVVVGLAQPPTDRFEVLRQVRAGDHTPGPFVAGPQDRL